MRKETAEQSLAIFDFSQPSRHYEDHSARQTIFGLKSPQLDFPHFALTPTRDADRFAAGLTSRTTVSAGYRCFGEPPEVFHSELTELSDVLGGGFSLEAGEGIVLIYRDELNSNGTALLEPYEIEMFLDQSLILYQKLLRVSQPMVHQANLCLI